MGSFGDKFRKERERQGVKLEDVSKSTKISVRMLRAIEEEHFDQLPGGVFNKGFIRAYAKHLGMDEEEAVASYLAALNHLDGTQPIPETVAVQPGAAADQSGNRGGERRADRRKGDRRSSAVPTSTDELPELQLPKAEHVRPRRKLAIHDDADGIGWRIPLLLALLLVSGAIWWTRSRNARTRGVGSAAAAVPLPAASSAPSGAGSNGYDNTVKPVASVAVSHAASPARPATQTPAPTPAQTPAKTTSHAALLPSSPQGSVAVNSPGHTESAPQEKRDAVATPPASKPRANLTLVIRAQENSWIAVTADGQPVIQETLIAPAHASIRATKEIVVRAGNSAGVTFSLNGEDFSPPASEGEVKTFMFDAAGMHETISDPPAGPVR